MGMKGYKGFGPGLVCRGKQYAENTVFEENEAIICESGMHFCENPLDVLDYYPLINDNAENNEFCEVEALDEPVTDDNKKYASKKLKIGARLSLKGFIEAAVGFVFGRTNDRNSGDWAKLAASGNAAQLAASGDWAKLAASGEKSVVCAIGKGGAVKAAVGSWITLAEYNGEGEIKCVKSVIVDGEKIKADTWYRLIDGEFVGVEGE